MGSDSLVRVWKVDQRERREPETCLDANEAITTLAVDVGPLVSSCVVLLNLL